jgi:hypothetical protein
LCAEKRMARDKEQDFHNDHSDMNHDKKVHRLDRESKVSGPILEMIP